MEILQTLCRAIPDGQSNQIPAIRPRKKARRVGSAAQGGQDFREEGNNCRLGERMEIVGQDQIPSGARHSGHGTSGELWHVLCKSRFESGTGGGYADSKHGHVSFDGSFPRTADGGQHGRQPGRDECGWTVPGRRHRGRHEPGPRVWQHKRNERFWRHGQCQYQFCRLASE